MTTITPIDSADLEDLRDGAQHALERICIPVESPLTADQLLWAADNYLAKLVTDASHTDDDDIEAIAFELGCLWGEQLIRTLGWIWIRVQFNEQSPEAIGVSSRDSSLVVYPFQTIFLCYEGVLPVRIARSYEVLSEPGRVPMLPPGGLENVMDHIR